LQAWLTIAELFGELQQPNFRADDLLFRRHGVVEAIVGVV
jgi:hypothetical protein